MREGWHLVTGVASLCVRRKVFYSYEGVREVTLLIEYYNNSQIVKESDHFV
jgi:hypothetical protein